MTAWQCAYDWEVNELERLERELLESLSRGDLEAA
jgi:hypothetical protein